MHPDVTPARSTAPLSFQEIWSPWRFNLGDHWQTVNYLITRSFILREEQLLSRWQHGRDCSKRFKEILALIKGPERSCVTLVDAVGSREPDGFDVWAAPSWPTHETWKPHELMNHDTVTYQFDGVSSAAEKNPPREDQTRMLAAMERGLNVYSVKRLGSDSTLAQCVDEMRRSIVFVGCDSGMSHIAHAVGVPTIIVEYGLPIITCHRGKHFVHVRGTDEAVKAIERTLR
jgi:hypothetical protein